MKDIRAGVYRHYKGQHYLVLGYGHDANYEGRNVVVYVGLELDGAHTGPRLAVRTADDFMASVCWTPECKNYGDAYEVLPDLSVCPVCTQWLKPRFVYVGPTWEG